MGAARGAAAPPRPTPRGPPAPRRSAPGRSSARTPRRAGHGGPDPVGGLSGGDPQQGRPRRSRPRRSLRVQAATCRKPNTPARWRPLRPCCDQLSSRPSSSACRCGLRIDHEFGRRRHRARWPGRPSAPLARRSSAASGPSPSTGPTLSRCRDAGRDGVRRFTVTPRPCRRRGEQPVHRYPAFVRTRPARPRPGFTLVAEFCCPPSSMVASQRSMSKAEVQRSPRSRRRPGCRTSAPRRRPPPRAPSRAAGRGRSRTRAGSGAGCAGGRCRRGTRRFQLGGAVAGAPGLGRQPARAASRRDRRLRRLRPGPPVDRDVRRRPRRFSSTAERDTAS